jgi:metallo-beta-lactamase family protein
MTVRSTVHRTRGTDEPRTIPTTSRPRTGPVLTFLGAAGTVTGSRFLVDAAASRVLVDVGLFQGTKELRLRNWQAFGVRPQTIDGVVLTHAHLDHTGWLPGLARDGFAGPVYATPSTIALTRIVLEDSARLQEEQAAHANRTGYSKHRPALPLYTTEDAARAIALLRPVPFGRCLEVAAGVRVELHPAGHILGSATVALDVDGTRLVISGDVGRPVHPLLRPPAPRPAADVLLCESTYGDRVHEPEERALQRLADTITRTARRGGVVVIPAFAVDRTEVVLHALGELRRDGVIPDLPVHVDSPMALAVLHVYRNAIARGDPELRLACDADLLAGGHLHEAVTTAQSKALNGIRFPSIIISSSGMATGGRVLHHLAERLPDPRNAVVLVGFQAEGTRGRLLADGARTLKLLGRYVPVRAEVVVADAFSVHADCDELVEWLVAAPAPRTTFVVHGESSASAAFRDRIDEQLGWAAVVPSHGERVRLD